MKFIFIPVSYETDFKNSGSERIRCDWMLPYLPADKYDGTQNLEDYDVIIYQKGYHPDMAKKFYGKKIQIWDLVDPLWRYNPKNLIREMERYIDFATIPTNDLAGDFKKFSNKPVYILPDRHEPLFYNVKKIHEDKKPVFVWFGYADNFERIKEIVPEIQDYDLLVIADKPVGYGKFIQWNKETINKEIIKGDIVIDIPDINRFKTSGHKTISAWFLGMPVVKCKEDISRFLNYEDRIREIEIREKELDKYHIKFSAEQLKKIIKEHTDKREISEKKSVLVSIPTSPSNPYIHKKVVMILPWLYFDQRYKVKIIYPTYNPFENNLHHIVNQFVEEGYDYWLNIDNDNPPMNNPLDLIELDKDIIGLPTPVLHTDDSKLGDSPVYLNAYKLFSEELGYKAYTPTEGLQQVDAIGTGCFIISKRVFENLEMRKAPFQRIYNEDGTVERGNDIAFCERAKKQGFEIWTHYDYQCEHFNEVPLANLFKHYKEFFKKHKIQ